MKNRNLVFLIVLLGMTSVGYCSRPGFPGRSDPAGTDERVSSASRGASAPRAPRAPTYAHRAAFPFVFQDWAGATRCLSRGPFIRVEARTGTGLSDGSATTIEIPLLGKLDVRGYSLLVLAVMLGLIDGFNPCAMWALVYLIALVVSLNDKWKIWLIVGTFVFSSGVWYFLFMSAWLNAFLFLGYIKPLTLGIGFLAMYVGIKGFIDLIRNRGVPACTLADDRSREKTIGRMRRILLSPVSVTSVISIIGLSFMINSIEFLCSCALPAVFTHVLSISHLSRVEHYGYILLYIFFFMLDDLIIFGSAAFAVTAFTGTRYVLYCQILGGILLIVLGGLLVFRPQVLLISS